MSSEGSVTSSGSRIRQFGLYRTIDARTEEFLRSSRKRQIRQGCACAAISTAITVTVVVSVILVYEYSINSESNVNKKISLKPNWIGLMNDSDITSISSKFNKKINFDRTTLKLLPILLKALNKNRYLEKILEDYSSSSPPYVGKDSTEATFTRNVFSDSKNWLKIPTSRHYTVDYKTSPLIYWKSPTQRLEYLTKIRKIRDYQRMLNYFDKMINDKVGSNQKKEFEYTENPLITETVPMKKDQVRKLQQLTHPLEPIKNKKEFKTEDKEGFVSCKCPKKLGQLLSKLIAGIQDMIPHMISNKLGRHPCGNETKPMNTLRQLTTAPTVRPTKQRIHNLATTVAIGSPQNTVHKLRTRFTTHSPKRKRTTRKSTSTITTSSTTSRATLSTTSSTTSSTTTSTTTSTVPSTTPKATTTIAASTTISDTSTDPTIGDFENPNPIEDTTIQLPKEVYTFMPNYQIYEKNTMDYDSIVKPTESPYTTTTKNPEIKHRTTEKFVPIKFIDSSREISSSEKWFDAYTVNPSYTRSNVPLYREEEYDDYFATTVSSKTSEFDKLDVHSMELIKNKIMASREYKTEKYFKKTAVNLKPMTYHPVVKQKDLDLTSMRKMADMIFLPHEKVAKEWKHTIEPKLSVPSYIKHTDVKLPTNSKIPNSVETYNPIKSNTNSLKNSIKIINPVPDVKTDQHEDTKISIDQQTSENVGDDEFQDEDSLRQAESTRAPYKYKNTTKIKDAGIEKLKQSNPWVLLKNEEKLAEKSPKSMLPSMRPIYLEVQRNNEWRQDDHADYDINFNNNIFDLPNIN